MKKIQIYPIHDCFYSNLKNQEIIADCYRESYNDIFENFTLDIIIINIFKHWYENNILFKNLLDINDIFVEDLINNNLKFNILLLKKPKKGIEEYDKLLENFINKQKLFKENKKFIRFK